MKRLALLAIPFLLLSSCNLAAPDLFGDSSSEPTSQKESTTGHKTGTNTSVDPTTAPSSPSSPSFPSTPTSTSSSSQPHKEIDGPFNLWTHYGAIYSYQIDNSFIDPIENNEKIKINHTSKGSTQDLLQSVLQSVSTNYYPNMANGYHSHLVQYNKAQILTSLDKYLSDSSINTSHYEQYGYSLLDDYYAEYLYPNQHICYDSSDKAFTAALPFSTSKDVMAYNGIFVDYAKSINPTLKVPSTWDEWRLYGPLFRDIQLSLNGKYLCGKITEEGTAYDFHVETTNQNDMLLDFSDVNEYNSAVMSYDSLENLFITLVRQYGAQYTSYTDDDRHQYGHGFMEFYSGSNQAKTIAALEMIKDLGDARIFATPYSLGGLYASSAFQQNNVMFVACSSGGLSYMTGETRVRFAPIPYYEPSNKFVINNEVSMCLFNQGCKDDPSAYTKDQVAELCFKALTKMTTGEYQANWAVRTGYYPVSKSAANSAIYQSMLNSTDYSDSVTLAYREAAQLNQNEYMNVDKAWINFAEPAFDGSDIIRNALRSIIGNVLINEKENIPQILQSVYNSSTLSPYVRH